MFLCEGHRPKALTWDPDRRQEHKRPPRTGQAEPRATSIVDLTCPPVLVPALGLLRAYRKRDIPAPLQNEWKAEQLTRGTLLGTAEFKEATFIQAPQSTTNLRRYLDNDRTSTGSYVYGPL